MLEGITSDKYNINDALLYGRNREEHDKRLEAARMRR